jgi:hypothetical protein
MFKLQLRGHGKNVSNIANDITFLTCRSQTTQTEIILCHPKWQRQVQQRLSCVAVAVVLAAVVCIKLRQWKHSFNEKGIKNSSIQNYLFRVKG